MSVQSVTLLGLTVASVASACARGPSTVDANPRAEAPGATIPAEATPDTGVVPAVPPAHADPAPKSSGGDNTARPTPTMTLPYKPKRPESAD